MYVSEARVSFYRNRNVCKAWARFRRGRDFSPVFLQDDSFSSFAVGWLQMDFNTLVKFHRGRGFSPVICWNDSCSAFAVGWLQTEFVGLQSVSEAFPGVSFLTIYLSKWFLQYNRPYVHMITNGIRMLCKTRVRFHRGRSFACHLTRRFPSACLYVGWLKMELI